MAYYQRMVSHHERWLDRQASSKAILARLEKEEAKAASATPVEVPAIQSPEEDK